MTSLAERIAAKAREEFGYTIFNGLRMIGVTEEKLAALIAAELKERDAKIKDGIYAGLQALSMLERIEPELWEVPVQEEGELADYKQRLSKARTLLEGGDDG